MRAVFPRDPYAFGVEYNGKEFLQKSAPEQAREKISCFKSPRKIANIQTVKKKKD